MTNLSWNRLLAPGTIRALAVGAISFTILAAAGFAGPTAEMASMSEEVSHDGTFSYRADVEPSVVYPDGRIDRGDPIFRSATHRLTLHYDHQLRTNGLVIGDGSLGADVILRIGAWEHELDTVDPRPLHDGGGDIETTIDLSLVDRVVERYLTVSGESAAEPIVLLHPRVTADIGEAGTDASTSFGTPLSLRIDPDSVHIDRSTLDVAGAEAFEVARQRPRSVELLGRAVSAALARRLGIVGGLLCLAVLLVALRSLRLARGGAAVRAALGARLVPVAPLLTESGAISVIHPRGFIRLASETDTAVLHGIDERGAETFAVHIHGRQFHFTSTPAVVGGTAPAA